MTQRRNVGGARREATERVSLKFGDDEVAGWALNVSRGGVRVVIDSCLEVGLEGEVSVGAETSRLARVVWARDEGGGQIVGLEFLPLKS